MELRADPQTGLANFGLGHDVFSEYDGLVHTEMQNIGAGLPFSGSIADCQVSAAAGEGMMYLRQFSLTEAPYALIGDSITVGLMWGLGSRNGQEMSFLPVSVVHRGFNGRRFDQAGPNQVFDFYAAESYLQGIRRVIVGPIGTNDVDIWPDNDTAVVAGRDLYIGNMQTLCADLAAQQLDDVILVTIPPKGPKNASGQNNFRSPRKAAAVAAINAEIRRLATEYSFGLLECHDLLSDGADQFASGLTDDGQHPNAAGYQLLARELENVIER